MKRLLFIFSFLFLTAGVCFAQKPPVTAELVPQKSGIFPNEKIYLALRLKQDKGWHLYWRNSGDAGEPVDLKLSLPEGFEETERLWPYPERFMTEGMAEYGYGGEAVLLVGIKAPENLPLNAKLEITGNVTWMACKNECVPGSSELSAYLTSGMADGENPLIETALAKIPQTLLSVLPFREREGSLVLEIPYADFKTAYFFPDSAKVIDHAGEQTVKTAENGKKYLFMPKRKNRDAAAFSGTLVLYGGNGATVKAFNLNAEKTDTPLPEFALPFIWRDFIGALILAFAGGFLLNLMPCVFPVLSLKAFKIVSSAGSNAAVLKKESLFYTAGVLTSFLAVGGVLIGLRAAGAELGWGFQLQYPPFVLFLCVFLFVLGLLFSDAASFGETISSKGASASAEWGDFGTGVLAVFVATPCAAPFMGTALGYGMIAPVPVTAAVFAAMGTGMALPFLLLGFFPSLACALPKSGAWTVLFRKVLAFPLYGAAGWLLWVLSAQGGPFALAAGIACLTAAGFAVWLCGEVREHPRLKSLSRAVFAVFLVLCGFAVRSVSPEVRERAASAAVEWMPYDEKKVGEYRQKGVPVFIKFSASWCLTCLMNDKAVLDSEKTAKLFRTKGIAAFFGDWTERDDRITRALESFGRGGIPLYVYYPPHTEKPVVFPQILTGKALENALSDL